MLLWMDGFDHYGDDETQMLDGVYADVNAGLSSVQARTGSRSIKFFASQSLRRIFGASKTTVGIGCAYFPEILPTQNYQHVWTFNDANNLNQLYIHVTTTGAIRVCRGERSALGSEVQLAISSDAAVVASAWQHIEMKVTIHPSAGAFEVRVNGVTVVSGSGVNTAFQGSPGTSQLIIDGGGSSSSNIYIDDLYAYDTTGTENNDWMGDLRVRTIMPNDDTAQADWLKSSGTVGYQLIDEIPADDDTSYIYNEAFGDGGEVSEFEFEDIDGAIASIRAVQTYAKQRKTVAGTCNTQVSVVSGTSVSLGADRPITEEYTYWMDVHEVDPATGAPWTKDAINAMKLRIERTA